jgi:hypothetical protein
LYAIHIAARDFIDSPILLKQVQFLSVVGDSERDGERANGERGNVGPLVG